METNLARIEINASLHVLHVQGNDLELHLHIKNSLWVLGCNDIADTGVADTDVASAFAIKRRRSSIGVAAGTTAHQLLRRLSCPCGWPGRWRLAHAAADVRSMTPRRWKILPRCALTVPSVMSRSWAICLLARPLATYRSTSCSRPVSSVDGCSGR